MEKIPHRPNRPETMDGMRTSSDTAAQRSLSTPAQKPPELISCQNLPAPPPPKKK